MADEIEINPDLTKILDGTSKPAKPPTEEELLAALKHPRPPKGIMVSKALKRRIEEGRG